ncbi:MAG: hypothetical protein HeimC2_13240 [Candidatus Heimdallarchaeota archaeon LC_2]|nr:MAG: hypothetical protein HeimC2_13240 [Candidatus Heimdallarchaeota archaeon LC_2]
MSEEIEDSGSYYTDDAQPKKGGSIKKGIGVGVIVTLVFELFVSFALEADTNLVHRYIAYMLGIGALFVAALYAKSTWKMFFFGTPVIVGTSFVLPLASPDNFSGLMSPFLNLLPAINAMVDSLKATGEDLSKYDTYIDYLNNPLYGILFDFVLAILIGTIAALGLVGFVKIFSNKPGIFTVISFIFSLFFFILGVIVLPYLLVVSTGVAQFGLALGAGGVNLQAGFEIITEDGDITEAEAFFDEAERWFDEADSLLKGLEDMQVFALLGSTDQFPNYEILMDNFIIMIDSAVDMAKTVGPMFLGISALQDGMEKSMSVLTSALGNTNLQISELSPGDEATFEEGIDDIQLGFVNIKDAIPDIQSALTRFEEVSRAETLGAADSEGVDVEEQFNLIEGTLKLLNSSLGVLSVLISPSDFNSTAGITVEEPLVHLLRGAISLSDASSAVGDTSSFEGTSGIFDDIISHLEIVVYALADPVFDDFVNTNVNDVTVLLEIKTQLSGMFDFIQDAGSISIAMGEFGNIAGGTVLSMNQTISTVFATGDFLTVDEDTYDSAKLNFTKSDGILNGSEQMKNEGANVDTLVGLMEARSLADEYGLMSAGASDFVNVFEEFDMGLNGQNFFHLSHAFFNIILTAEQLKVVDGLVSNIKTDFEFIFALDYATNASAIDPAVNNIEGNSTDIVDSLDTIDEKLTYTAGNFSAIGNTMSQMAETATAIDGPTGIIFNVGQIRTAIEIIEFEASETITVGNFPSKLITIDGQLTIIQAQLVLINVNLGNVQIAG